MSPIDLLEKQEAVQEKPKMPDLTTVEGMHAFFNEATSYEDECGRYNEIIDANGGLRPTALDEYPLLCRGYSFSRFNRGPASGE